MGNREDAEGYLQQGEPEVATAHAVLALLDYLQQDDTFEATQPHGSYGIYQASRITQLEEELEATRAALRAREEADAAEMKAAQEAREK